ncbi:MAG: hypothetical protein ACPGRZ_03245 [Alphaproteobacteria bacterium]
MATRIPRYLLRQLYLTLGFAALFGGLIALGENARGWDGLAYVLYALGAAMLWALVSAVYMIRVIIRERAGRASWPAMGVLAVVLALTALFAQWMDS